MNRYITILGAWSILFPINLTVAVVVTLVRLFVGIFNMPVDLWHHLDQELEQIHLEDK